jgi:16S rRNA processing protein RimM
VPDRLTAGVVGRPHGVDGSFHVHRPRPDLLREGSSVSVRGEAVRIVRRAGTDARPIVRLDGVGDRDGAEALRGVELMASAGEAPPLGPDEWWAEDLEGCAVVDGDRAVGVVRRLVALPSCEALEVARDGAGTLLVPMVADALRRVDIDARVIDVRLSFVEPGEEE